MSNLKTRPRVLITGGAGFIGSNLARRLITEGFDVRILDSLLPQVHGANPSLSSPLYRSVIDIADVRIGSVTDRNVVEQAVHDVDIVVHFAAETGTGQSMYEIERYVGTNGSGTALLLDVLANSAHSVKKLIVASSRSIYGEGKYLTGDGRAVYPPHRSESDIQAGDFAVHIQGIDDPLTLAATDEDSLIHPSSVYGITKQTQEQLVMTVCPTIGIAPVSLRYQNVYGPGQSLSNPYTGILSIFSTLINDGGKINVFEDGLESRDFVYIDDVVDATLRAMTSTAADGGIFNVGSGVPTTVNEVVDALLEAFEKRVEVEVTGNFRLGDIRHNFADLTRIRERLGFVPQVDFLSGVGKFVEWVEQQPKSGTLYQASLEEMRSRRLLK